MIKDIFRKPSPVELISLHIPKTAGTSFRHLLVSNYGQQQVAKFDIEPDGRVRLNNQPYAKKELPAYRVLHGHFVYDELIKRFAPAGKVPVITWLRHPVERVLSNYFYLQQIIRSHLNEKEAGIDVLSRMERSLLEFAADPRCCNVHSSFLQGADLSKFYFVGIIERFDSDVAQLGQKLGWENMQVPLHNRTETKRPEIDAATRQQIADLNKEDMALYQRFFEK